MVAPIFTPRTTTRLVLALITSALFASSINGAHAEQLKFAPAVGQKFQLSYDQTTIQTTEVSGKGVEMQFKMGMEMDWTVESVDDDGNVTVRQRFTRLNISIESPDVDPIKYDSADEARPIGYAADLAQTMQPFLAGDIHVTLSARGEVVKVEIPKETMDAFREAPGSMQLRDMLTSDGIAKTLGGAMAVLPAEQVEVGGTWVNERQAELTDGRLDQKHTYTYRGLTDLGTAQVHQIDVETELIFQQPMDEIRQPQEIVEQEFTGTLWLDPNLGIFVGAELTSTLITETDYRDNKITTAGETLFKMSAKAVDE